MKPLIVIASLLLLFLKPGPEVKYKVEYTLNQWQAVYAELNAVENFLDSSNLPHQDLKRIVAHLELVKGYFGAQLTPQIQAQVKIDSAEKAKAKKP